MQVPLGTALLRTALHVRVTVAVAVARGTVVSVGAGGGLEWSFRCALSVVYRVCRHTCVGRRLRRLVVVGR